MTANTLGAVFGMDGAKEKDGVVIQYGKVRVRLARAGGGNDRFAKIGEEVTRPYRRMIEHEVLPVEQAKVMAYEIYAKAVVLEWGGVTDADGNEIPYSVDACIDQFNKWPEFFTFVREEAARLSNYRARDLQADAGNSASA